MRDEKIYEMMSFIDEHWDEAGCAEKMTKKEAECYLGHSCKGMSKEEVDEEVSDVQRGYYTWDDPFGATDEEIEDMYLSIKDILAKAS